MLLCAKKLKLLNAGFFNQLSTSRKPLQFIRFQSVPSLAHFTPYYSDSVTEELNSSSIKKNGNGNSLELNSRAVVQILQNMRSEPYYALSFFNQLREKGFHHDTTTYLAMIKVLCNWRMERKSDCLFTDLIMSLEKGGNLELLDAIAEELKGESPRSQVRAFDSLVKSYASLEMFDEAIRALYEARRLGIGPCLSSCNFLMNRLVRHGKEGQEVAIAVYKELPNMGLEPNIYSYAVAVKAYCQMGRLDEGREVGRELDCLFTDLIRNLKEGDDLELLDAMADGPSSRVWVFDALVKSYASLGMFDEAIRALYEARRLGVGPSLLSCNFLMNRLVGHKEEGAAIAIYKELKILGLEPNIYSYEIAVKAYCRMGRLEEGREVGRELDCLFTDLIINFEKGDNLELLDAMADCPSSGVRVFDALIKSYASLGMFDEAICALYEARRLGIGPCLLSCNFLMNRLVGHGKEGAAIAIYKELKNLGLEPNRYTYGIAVKAYCRMGSLESLVDAGKVFPEMEKAGVVPNSFTYTPYLEGLCSHGFPGLAYEELQDWHAKNVHVDAYAYATVIRGYCDSGDVVKALAVHEEMESKGIRTNCSILSSILQCLCLKGRYSEAVNKFVNYEKSGVFLDGVVHNVAMDALCKMGKLDKAESLFDKMKLKELVPDVVHYTTLINGHYLTGNIADALRLFNEMNRSGLTADVIACNVLARGLARNGLLEMVSKLLNTMENQGLTPSIVTRSMIVEGLCHGGKVKEAEIWFKKLSSQEMFINRNSCADLIRSLCSEGQCNKAIKVLKIMLSTDDGPNKAMYDKLIAGLCRAGDMEKAQWAFDQMVGRGLTPDKVIYTIMLNGYCHVNRMQDAFTLFSDMKEKGIAPDVITYTALMSGYCKQGNMDKALSLKAEMLSVGIQPDTVMEEKVQFHH